ncbi:O-methyltransferase [Dictyobacter aurantiacus]|uniref:O-methyltransferase n=1 Tax=Dictyobacter aurantiacus TaxID=1936993 RepID=A0A401Z816_9CHLR|nr:O-methyltransferase [Dictyobacter aurantiacus]GCE02975.1 O-methyltransferase [Dictyobacter aurantiacus]
MSDSTLEQQTQKRHEIEEQIAQLFAPEDEGLRHALQAAKEKGLPEIQINPVQGKLLQVFAAANQSRKILEIGSLAGYSGIWLARALPADGRLISLELDPRHAEVIRASFAHAGVAERTEVRVGNALDLLPGLQAEAPFDLIFIDADKANYPHYLEWAIKLSRPGSVIIADNCVRDGRVFAASPNMDADTAGLVKYNQLTREHPRLTTIVLANDNDYTDGFNVAVVK